MGVFLCVCVHTPAALLFNYLLTQIANKARRMWSIDQNAAMSQSLQQMISKRNPANNSVVEEPFFDVRGQRLEGADWLEATERQRELN